jgi:hypothetical protein
MNDGDNEEYDDDDDNNDDDGYDVDDDDDNDDDGYDDNNDDGYDDKDDDYLIEISSTSTEQINNFIDFLIIYVIQVPQSSIIFIYAVIKYTKYMMINVI